MSLPSRAGAASAGRCSRENLRRATERAADGAGRARPSRPRSPRRRDRGRPPALLERRGFRADPLVLRHAPADLDDVPDAPLPEGLEIRPGHARPAPAIFEAESEAFRDHWSAREPTRRTSRSTFGRAGARHRPVGRGLGRRRDRGRRPDLDLARGERDARRRARLARAHQRPATVAATRPRPGDHRGGAAPPGGRRDDRGDARRRCREPDRGARAVRGARLRGRPARASPVGCRSGTDRQPSTRVASSSGRRWRIRSCVPT